MTVVAERGREGRIKIERGSSVKKKKKRHYNKTRPVEQGKLHTHCSIMLAKSVRMSGSMNESISSVFSFGFDVHKIQTKKNNENFVQYR